MSKNSVAEALRTLATSDKSRSETARLRDVFGEVEDALKAGVSRAAILETLHAQGFTMTPKSFESALYRLRKQTQSAPTTKPNVERVHVTISNNDREKGERVHVSILEQAGAATPQDLTPKGEHQEQDGQGDDLAGLTTKERRERRASQFIKDEKPNPLLKNLKGKTQ